MRYLILLLAAVAITGCTWETYQTSDGHTSLRQKYAPGTRVYYQDGTYSHSMQYNQYRPEQHAIKPNHSTPSNVKNTTWGNSNEQTQ